MVRWCWCVSKAIYMADGGSLVKYGKIYEVVNGLYNKILKGYVVEDGVLKLFYSYSIFDSYTGDYTVTEVEDEDGSKYYLYALTSSGTLKLNEDTEVWLCGGGAGGLSGWRKTSGSSSTTTIVRGGGGGGGGYTETGILAADTYVIEIGTGGSSAGAGSATTITDGQGAVVFTAAGGAIGNGTTGGAGGSGGGAARYRSNFGSSAGTAGSGSGVSTYPFELTSLSAHCGGGGGGAFRCLTYLGSGGAGGTNGGNGGTGSNQTGSSSAGYTASGGAGGTKGGGTGGGVGSTNSSYTASAGSAATFYGSGGGGGGAYFRSTGSGSAQSGGAGYQGIVYLLVPSNIQNFTAYGVKFTGTNSVTTIDIDGETWNLMTITDSGTLTIAGGQAKVWMCGGGGGGHGSQNGYNSAASSGGSGGGGGYVGNTRLQAGEYTITIGAGASPTYSTYTSSGSASTIESEEITLLECLGGESGYNASSYTYGGNGGSGGGTGYYGTGYVGSKGKGAGVSTYPFGIASLKAHSAGGGGGAWAFNNSDYGTDIRGGDGGSNGSNGFATNTNSYVNNTCPGGSGGEFGGGNGGNGMDASLAAPDGGYAGGNGTTGTFYGAGGGGGGKVTWYTGEQRQGIGGTGYQGVGYVLWQPDPIRTGTVSFDGNSALSSVSIDEVEYNLLTMTSSGTITVGRDDVRIYVCGGGSGGETGEYISDGTSPTTQYAGRGGCGGCTNEKEIRAGIYSVVIGTGGANDSNGGDTSILQTDPDVVVLNAKGGTLYTGGSGGGGCAGYRSGDEVVVNAGSGQGMTTVPFGVKTLFAHGAGGGGGEIWSACYGGNGGSDGVDGDNNEGTGAGGTKGGGQGGNNNQYKGGNATFYGSGGGGGKGVAVSGVDPFDNTYYPRGGTGYQGVAYALWPKS